MTDRELLEYAGKAAGITLIEYDAACDWFAIVNDNEEASDYWNPLNDDGDALRLAVCLTIDTYWSKDGERVYAGRATEASYPQSIDNDPCAATRRAIVNAAAEIGREVK